MILLDSVGGQDSCNSLEIDMTCEMIIVFRLFVILNKVANRPRKSQNPWVERTGFWRGAMEDLMPKGLGTRRDLVPRRT